VLHRLSNAGLVIDVDVGNVGTIRAHIDKHKRDLSHSEVLQQSVFHADCKNGDAVDAPLNHPPHRQFHSSGIVHGRTQKNLIFVFDCKVGSTMTTMADSICSCAGSPTTARRS
jgi:hypothetical protein